MEVSLQYTSGHSLLQKPLCKKPIYCNKLRMQLSGVKRTNFYQLLSVSSPSAGFDEIKKAYKSMALQFHPDVCIHNNTTKEESTKRFIELREAYETLSDPTTRRIYDMGLEDPSGPIRSSHGPCGRFPREVWETQLSELRKRSSTRSMKKHQTQAPCNNII